MWQTYINAENIDQVLEVLHEKKENARIIAGGTDLVLEMERGNRSDIDTLIDVSRIPDLNKIVEDKNGVIHLGPLVTHNDCVGSALLKTKALPLVQAAWEVGSPQIRNRGTITGNVVTASPANDTISPLMALDAEIQLSSKTEIRVVKLSEFYKGVRKTIIRPDEMVTDISFPGMGNETHGAYMKSALRKAQAISVVNATVILQMKGDMVEKAAVTLGAVAPTIIHARETEDFLIGKILTDDVVETASSYVKKAARPIDDLRGSAAYRLHICSVLVKRGLIALSCKEKIGTLLDNPPLLKSGELRYDTSIYGEINENTPIETTINGQKFVFRNGQEKTLLRLIREDAGLIGTKEGCAEGECGACTVYMDGAAVMSCLIPAPRSHGAVITTIEGMAKGDTLHPVQQAFVEEGAVQCGYCTPGFVMSAAKLLEENPSPSENEIKQALTGNLCRCTGYYKIISAVDKAAGVMKKNG